MQLGPEDIPIHIPSYLTEDRKPGFLAELKKFKELVRFYQPLQDPEPLQGDGWHRLPIYDFETGELDHIKGIVLSNSCDLAAENSALIPPTLVFAPIVAISTYRGVLEEEGIETEVIEQNLKDIREQRISTMFFLPAAGVLAEDHIAKMDEAYTVPASHFQVADPPTRMFSLYDVAFYLFTFKLSYHFCRLHEKIDRTPA
jgi:hypothetical protein